MAAVSDPDPSYLPYRTAYPYMYGYRLSTYMYSNTSTTTGTKVLYRTIRVYSCTLDLLYRYMCDF